MFDNERKLDLSLKTFDVLDLGLFKNFRFRTLFNYVVVFWGLTILKVVLFASDIYTCVKLLAFNSWSNNIIKPYLSFRISKWLFSGCILASIALMLWEVVNGIRISKTRSIALTYVNNFSRTLYSIRDYNVFCVYNKITPKGHFQRISFHTFFEFKDCARLLFTDTPRQVINGLTLWSVLVTDNNGANLGKLENFNGLITKIKIIAETNHQEAVLLSFMLLSFVIWTVFISKLLVAVIFSPFVYHRIYADPSVRGLKDYVCTTVNKRVDQLIEKYEWKKEQKTALELSLVNNFSVQSLYDLEKNPLPESNSGSTFALPNKFTPVPFTSMINRDAATSTDYLQPRTTFSSQQNVTRLQLKSDGPTKSSVNPFRANPLNETTESFDLSNTSDMDVSFNNRRPFIKQLTIDTQVQKLDSNSRSDSIGSVDNCENDGMRSPLLSNEVSNYAVQHVTTPDQLYFNQESMYPARSTSLLDRRFRMENEDYELYADRFSRNK